MVISYCGQISAKGGNFFMEKNKNMFLSSAKELKSVPALAMCAMFAALALILNSVASINLGPYIKIGFSGNGTKPDC